MKPKFFLCLAVILLIFNSVTAQDNALFIEDSAYFYLDSALKTNDDNLKLFLENKASQKIELLLNSTDPFVYDFKLLKKKVSILKSEDKKLLVLTWGTDFSDGTYKYWGFLAYKAKKKDKTLIFKLTDQSDKIPNPEKAILNPQKWYGCIYYEIITEKQGKNVFYTLLGWDGNNLLTTKKIIEILTFKNDKPKFGGVFELPDKRVRRVIFEYSQQAVMTLRWEPKLKMIIFDHLAPSEPKFVGLYQYYGPDFSYDGLYFKKGKWLIKEDIPVKNPKPKKK